MANTSVDPYAQQRQNGRIHVRILDAKTGLTELDGVFAIRIHSRDVNLLIMNDYVPTLGKLRGDVMFLDARGEHSYRQVQGFYKHQHNEFTLLIEAYMEKEEKLETENKLETEKKLEKGAPAL